VRLGIEAPPEVTVDREEIAVEKRRNRMQNVMRVRGTSRRVKTGTYDLGHRASIGGQKVLRVFIQVDSPCGPSHENNWVHDVYQMRIRDGARGGLLVSVNARNEEEVMEKLGFPVVSKRESTGSAH